MLDKGHDWELRVDLDRKLVVSIIIESTQLKTIRNISVQPVEDVGCK